MRTKLASGLALLVSVSLSSPLLTGCGGPPPSEDVASESSAFTLGPSPIHILPSCSLFNDCPPWQTSTRGVQIQYVDANGNPSSTIVVTHASTQAPNAFTATGAVSVSAAVWDYVTIDGSVAKYCAATMSPVTMPGQPWISVDGPTIPAGSVTLSQWTSASMLCTGTPTFFSAPLDLSAGGGIAQALLQATGAADLGFACRATENRGYTAQITAYAAAEAFHSDPVIEDGIAEGSSDVKLPLTIVLQCQ